MTLIHLSCTVESVAGCKEALLGLSFNKKTDLHRMPAVAGKLAPMGNGHNKFMRQIVLWLNIRGPRYWWQEFDTYKTVLAAQSESTMHTLFEDAAKIPAWIESEFEIDLPEGLRVALTDAIKAKDLVRAKQLLPECFLQRRMVALNLMTLQHIFRQRHTHRLPHWPAFLAQVGRELQALQSAEKTSGLDLWSMVIS